MSSKIPKFCKVKTSFIDLAVPFSAILIIGIVFIVQFSLGTLPASAVGDLTAGRSEALVNSVFPQNNITGWNPLECVTKGGNSGSCFKIDSSIDAQDFWYAEGCLSKCKSSSYAHTAYDSENPFLRDDTESDEELGGMLYIYADNYDIDYDAGWIPKFSPNGGNSTQKYYWIVLPSEAYSNGFGETFVATFENLSEPIYFITFDTHACGDQGEDYCGKASSDPDGVQAGREFLGAITDTGSPTSAANILGKLTSLCRINGQGEVTASHNASNTPSTTSRKTSGSSDSSSASGNCTTYEGEYPEYLQADEPWGSMSYGPGCTFAGCACGATSMAMLATYVTGQDVFPTDVAELLGSSYYWQTGGSGATELDKKVCEKYGCEAEAVSWSGYDDAINKMKQYLNEGYSIHLSGAGGYPFSDGGHYIGIFSINGDNVMTANSAFGGNAEMNLSDLVHAGLHYDFTIIKGDGSKNTCDNNYCPEESANTSVDGGLTEDQAQKIADYYNSDAVSAAGLPMGTKENCVSFSAWFVSYLTNVTDATNPTRGDGLEVANNLVADYGVSGGDTPQVWSVFSNPTGTSVNGSSNHTGVIVGIEDGQAITIEAAWGGWAGQSDGLARVWKYAMPESGMYYAYFSDHLESSKISDIIGGS